MTSISPDARTIWRAARGPAAILLLLVAVSVVITLLRGAGGDARLDPTSADPAGSRALASLLTAQGVRVATTRTADDTERAAQGATVLVTMPDWVSPQRLRTLADLAGHLVLIAPGQDTVDAVMPGTRVEGETGIASREPSCGLEIAAGTASMGGLQYQSDATTCYAGTLIQSTVDDVTLLGTGEPLTNARLDDDANAAFTMRLLGQHERLVWFVPSPADAVPPTEQRTLAELVPDGVRFGLLQLVVAVVLLALWRARRLGPAVTEPLPVVVRAAETVEGRARLYRRAGAADHAGEALRQAARDRLVRRLGLPRDAEPATVAAAVAGRTGRPESETRILLYGPPSTDEAGLVRLADALDSLENDL